MQQEYSQQLQLPIETLQIIQKNPYCAIYIAENAGQKYIIKKYREQDGAKHVRAEAAAIDTYHNIVAANSQWLDCQTVRAVPEHCLLCISFVPGEPLNRIIYKSCRDKKQQPKVLEIMHSIGKISREILQQTQKQQPLDDFFATYLRYCCEKLETLPVLGKRLWKNEKQQAEKLIDRIADFSETNFIHGDFVPLNIHVSGDKVGLIDFANSNHCGHFTSDFYNLYFAIWEMPIAQSYRHKIIQAYLSGLGKITVPQEINEFFYEYHRKRWLMLKVCRKISSKSPIHWLQFARGHLGFAKPYQQALAANLFL